MENNRRFSPMVVDTLIAIGVFVLGLISVVEIKDTAVAEVFSRQTDAFGYLLIGLQTLPLMFRRRWPLWILGIVTAGFVVDRVLDYPNTLASAGILLGIHAVGSELPRSRSLRIGASYVAGVALFTTIGATYLASVGWGDVIATALLTGVPLFLGREVHERRRRFEELQERAEKAELDREAASKQAVADERSRIARELHDVVAHQMTVMTLQAEGARRLAGDSDSRVLIALDTIKDAGHSALAEMRRMVGVLRTEDSNADLIPLPRLAQVSDLVQQIRNAGPDVTLEVIGEPVSVDTGVELSAYRIIQESLTNVARHGGPHVAATVVITYDEDSLDVEIRDNGRGSAAVVTESGGHGLAGMKERVLVLNGEFEAGPNPGGGFKVFASLPYRS